MRRITAIALILCMLLLPLGAGALSASSQVGTDVSGFSSVWLDGSSVDGRIFSGYGVSVVCWFATWDQSSLDQLAILQNVHTKYPNYGVFGALKVDATSTPEAALAYMDGMEYDFGVFVCDSVWQGVVSQSMFIPQTFIVNGDGIIVEAWQAAFTSSETLEERLNYWNSVNAVDGDVDGNGIVDSLDALLALRIALGIVIPNAEQQQHGDINGDGTIDVVDVLWILRRAMGIF